jgi:hypothetical protein
MTLAAATAELWWNLNRLRDSLRVLQLTTVEDRPRDSDLVPVESLGEGVEEALGIVHESFETAARTVPPPTAEPDPRELRRALATIQDGVDQLSLHVGFDLASHQRLGDLDELAADRGGEWEAWMAGVRLALEHCQPPIRATHQALLACWLELTEPSQAPAGPSTRPAGNT